jgi:RNA polymerase-interacting CarD/CdnL/TRCF family regulator
MLGVSIMGVLRNRNLYSPEELIFLKEQFNTNKKIPEICEEFNAKFNADRTISALTCARTTLRKKMRDAAECVEVAIDETDVAEKEQKKKVALKAAMKALKTIPNTMPIETMKKGTLLYHPDCGVMRSRGLVKEEVGGLTYETLGLDEVYASSVKIKTSALRQSIPKKKIASINIRSLYDAESMKKAVDYLRASESMGVIPGNTTQKKIGYLSELEKSGDLKDMCELIVRVYKNNQFAHGRGFSDIGMRALKKFTGEYAAINRIPFDNAKEFVQEALGFEHVHGMTPKTLENTP